MANQYDYSDKLTLYYTIETIRAKVRGWLENYVTGDALEKALADFKITVDSVLSDTSTNPVQNAVIKSVLDKKAPLTSPEFAGVPTTPTPLSGNSSGQVANTEFVQQAINSALAGITGINFSVVEALPESGEKGTFYLLKSDRADANNAYVEYVWVNGKWEAIGDTTVDLTGYLREEQLVPITEQEVDAMFVGWGE